MVNKKNLHNWDTATRINELLMLKNKYVWLDNNKDFINLVDKRIDQLNANS